MPAILCRTTLESSAASQGVAPGSSRTRATTTCGRLTMTALAPPRSNFAVLDRLILEALSDLRSARAAAARKGDRENLDLHMRAEEHLNALLDYRHAAARR
jgi:hypothetical protein